MFLNSSKYYTTIDTTSKIYHRNMTHTHKSKFYEYKAKRVSLTILAFAVSLVSIFLFLLVPTGKIPVILNMRYMKIKLYDHKVINILK